MNLEEIVIKNPTFIKVLLLLEKYNTRREMLQNSDLSLVVIIKSLKYMHSLKLVVFFIDKRKHVYNFTKIGLLLLSHIKISNEIIRQQNIKGENKNE